MAKNSIAENEKMTKGVLEAVLHGQVSQAEARKMKVQRRSPCV